MGAEDIESVDLENIDTTGAPGGFFASYHAYPYYPNFMTRDRALQNVRDREGLNIGFDTYDDAAGEIILPGGITSTKRSEFALVLKAPNDAQLYVTPAYDLFGIWHGTSSDAQLYYSVASNRGEWVLVRWKNDSAAIAEDGSVIPEAIDEIGRLLVRFPGGTQTSREAIGIDGGRIDVRVPWTLLQFADPSRRSVIDDDRTTLDRETAISEGIAVSIHVGKDHVDTGRFRWDGWEEVPATSERKKDSTEV